MWLFLLFLAIPLIEIALFIQIGGVIGLGWTLAIVVITAVIGTWMVRSQGAQVLSQVKTSFDELRDPTEPLAHGAMILFSGALLLTPGFFTDTLGFALLLPPVRVAVFRFLRSRVRVETFSTGESAQPRTPPRDPGVIDGEWEEVKTTKRPTHRPDGNPSGWTRH